jgi:hypothetical protein
MFYLTPPRHISTLRDIPKIRATRRERLQFFADHAMALANKTGE